MLRGHVALMPRTLDAKVELEVERRSRGLFEALIYGARVTLTSRARRWGSRSRMKRTSIAC